MSKHARTLTPGLQLNGREVAAEAHLLILSFLSLKELLCLRPVSPGWRARAEEALPRLTGVTLRGDGRVFAEALRWCRRLQALGVEQVESRLDLAQLIAQNRATLTAIDFSSSDLTAAVWDAVSKCHSLRRLLIFGTRLIGRADINKVFSSFPLLEELAARRVDWEAVLSSSIRRPLKRLSSSSSLRTLQLAQLASAYQGLVELDICSRDADPTSLFEALARLPGLERARITAEVTRPTTGTPAPPDDKRPVLKALRSLELVWFTEELALTDSLHFSAPGLRELALHVDSSTLPIALLVERFPALTSLSASCDLPGEDSEDVKAAAALLSRAPKAWAQLSKLRVAPPYAHGFVPSLYRLCGEGRLPALTELEVSRGDLTRRELLLLLRSLPGLRSLSLSSVPWCPEGDVEEAGCIPPSSTSLMEKLCVSYCAVGVLGALTDAFRFPRLRLVRLTEIGRELAGSEGEEGSERVNAMPLLLPARETLQELQIDDRYRNCLCLSFPPGTAEAEKSFPRLRVVKLKGCEVDEDVRQALSPV